jgi:hypothetical protein
MRRGVPPSGIRVRRTRLVDSRRPGPLTRSDSRAEGLYRTAFGERGRKDGLDMQPMARANQDWSSIDRFAARSYRVSLADPEVGSLRLITL